MLQLEKSQNKTNYKVGRYGKELKEQKVYISGKMEKVVDKIL
jgi:hypothetical protein